MTIRFGTMRIPGAGSRSGRSWAESARAAEHEGYRTLLLPDTLNTPSPFPALAAAAAVTDVLRLRPNVLATPLRSMAATVREAAALQMLSDGRFELGLGVGRPDARTEAERLGAGWGSVTERRAQVIDTVAAVRAGVTPVPEVMIAAAGPRMLAAAAGVADRILLAAGLTITDVELVTLVGAVRERTDRPVAFSVQIMAVGDAMPQQPPHWRLPSAAELRAAGSIAALPDDPGAAAEILEFRREEYGIDEVIVPGDLATQFAPILKRCR